jgi:hypothetical protein
MSAAFVSTTAIGAHRVMVGRIIAESSFEAILDLVVEEAAARAGLHNQRPTIKQNRYRQLGPALQLALHSAVAGRV